MIFGKKHKLCFKDKDWLWLSASGLLFLSASFVVNFYAGRYANSAASNSVSDIILSNIRVFDVDIIFVYGAIAFWIFVICLALSRPLTIPFICKSVALFVLIRSLFISLTHIAVFPYHLIIDTPHMLSWFTSYGDLFFSGHTGLPFLMALVFWKDKYLRILFISISIIFGITVLLGHLHYSIDVLAAFFITNTIYQLAVRFFKRDKALFDAGI
jgi:hypothetical protein